MKLVSTEHKQNEEMQRWNRRVLAAKDPQAPRQTGLAGEVT